MSSPKNLQANGEEVKKNHGQNGDVYIWLC